MCEYKCVKVILFRCFAVHKIALFIMIVSICPISDSKIWCVRSYKYCKACDLFGTGKFTVYSSIWKECL